MGTTYQEPSDKGPKRASKRPNNMSHQFQVTRLAA